MNCKPGDLAIVIGGAIPENIGKIVQVDHLVLPGQTLRPGVIYGGNEPAWSVTGNLCTRDFFGENLRRVPQLSYSDCFLRPLPALPVEDEVTDQVPA